MIVTVTLASAQNYEPVKTLLTVNQYRKAKEDFDKAMTNTKYAAKAEAYILKVGIYAGLAMDKTVQGTPEAAQLTMEAAEAFKKYKEMQPDLSLASDLVYQNGPINLYASIYAMGYKDYEAKKWEESYQKYQTAVELSDFLINQKIFKTPIDTSVLILAGLTAENAKHDDDAAKAYSRLADKKIGGEGMESVYRFLVNYSFKKGDIASFEKYKATGKELFPKSEFFNFDKIDFAVGLVDDFDSKLKALDQVLATSPDDSKANEVLGEVIFDTLNPKNEGGKLPSNADELEKKMVNAFTKAAATRPDWETPYIYMGDHFITKAVRVGEARDAFATQLKSKVKPGAKPTPTDAAKRDSLESQYANALDRARDPYEKAAAIMAKRGDALKQNEKAQYKKVVGYLTDIYTNKKTQAKGKPAEVAKYAAEEKKWNDIYESIKLR